MKKKFRVFFIPLIIFTSCLATAKKEKEVADFPHYDINLKVDPVSRLIDVEGEFTCMPGQSDTTALSFYLDEELAISYIRINGQDMDFSLSGESDIRFMPEAVIYSIPLGELKQKANPLRVKFAYKGGLSQLPSGWANRLEASWSELGLYYPWFPIFNSANSRFTFLVEVDTPEQYEAFGLGQVRQLNGKYQISSKIPTNDIVVCLSQDIKSHTSSIGSSELKIFHKNFSDTLTQVMSEDISDILAEFNQWFGPINMDLSLIESQRQSGGGYARTGGVVLSGIEEDSYFSNREGYARYFGHEFAHLWWFRADSNTWEDWLNESFAEYSALMFLRQTRGKDFFQKWISSKKKNLEGTPPIWGFDRQHADYAVVNEVLYNKGPVLLYELEEKIGPQAFIDLCVELINEEVSTTEGFFAILDANHGNEVSDYFKNLLLKR